MSHAIFWKTIRTFALWGYWWALLFQWLGIMIVFYAGTLIGRPDLNILEKLLGIFSGAFYGLIVFTVPALLAALFAFVFVLLAGIAVAIWNRDNGRMGYAVPLAIGLMLGAAFAALNARYDFSIFARYPYFWIADVAAVALASLLCWRRFRKNNPPVQA